MRGKGTVIGAVAGKLGRQLLVRTVVTGGHHNERHYCTAAVAGVAQSTQHVQEYVYALVLVLIAAAYTQDKRIGAVLSAHGIGQVKQDFPALRGSLLKLVLGRHDSVVEAVGRNQVHLLAQQFLTFRSRNVAYRGEHVRVQGRALLHGMFRGHIVIAGLLIGVAVGQGVIQRHVVAGQAASRHRGVCGEDSGHMSLYALEIKDTGTGHPLVEMSHDLVMRLEIEAHETLYHLSGRIAEQGRLYKVPLPGYGVQLELLPQRGEYLVLLRDELREIHQHGYGLARDVPAAHPEPQSLLRSGHAPCTEKNGVFGEFRVLGSIHPDIRTYMDVVVF